MTAFHDVGALTEFPEGKIRRRMLEGAEVAVVLWQGRFYAFANRCPHADFQMNFGYIEDDRLHCPIHYAEFDLETGACTYGPGGTPAIAAYATRINEGRVEVALTPVSEASS
jgi:nitrite reductase/ring-hydroxylating ferredoxin subunit